MRHRRFLTEKHPFRRMKGKFDNTFEKGVAPAILTGAQIYARVEHLKVVLGKTVTSLTFPIFGKSKKLFQQLIIA